MAAGRDTINNFMDKVLYDTQSGGENDLDAAIAAFRNLQGTAYTMVSAGNGQVISTSGNGKTVTVSTSAGLSQQDIFNIASEAIRWLRQGATYIPNRSIGRF